MDNKFKEQILTIQKLETTYVAFCRGTNLPFVVCDKDTFNDQIWVFTTEENAKKFGEKCQEEEKNLLVIVKMTNNQLLGFYSSLYTLGVNEVVLAEETKTTKIPLEKLVKQPDYSKLPENQRPLLNPQMQLTGIYFMQELHRQVPNSDKSNLRDLEEEMAANLVRCRFLMAVEIEGDKAATDGSNVKIPCVKNKEGKMYQPIFTDPAEYQKFNKEQKYQARLVDFDNVQKVLGNNVEGLVVNPQGINIVIMKEKIQVIKDRFPTS